MAPDARSRKAKHKATAGPEERRQGRIASVFTLKSTPWPLFWDGKVPLLPGEIPVGRVEKLAPDGRTIMVKVNARVVKWQTRTFEGRMP